KTTGENLFRNYTGMPSNFTSVPDVILKASKGTLVSDFRIVRVVHGTSAKIGFEFRSLDTKANQAIKANPQTQRPVFTTATVNTSAFKAGSCFAFGMVVNDAFDNQTTGYTGITQARLVLQNASSISSNFKRSGNEQSFSSFYSSNLNPRWQPYSSGPVVQRHLFGSNFYSYKYMNPAVVEEQIALDVPDWQMIPVGELLADDTCG
ncbi:hypothetical protein EBR21_10700, partial [bacterium]|nr:hypothetical protein [bacterium]